MLNTDCYVKAAILAYIYVLLCLLKFQSKTLRIITNARVYLKHQTHDLCVISVMDEILARTKTYRKRITNYPNMLAISRVHPKGKEVEVSPDGKRIRYK